MSGDRSRTTAARVRSVVPVVALPALLAAPAAAGDLPVLFLGDIIGWVAGVITGVIRFVINTIVLALGNILMNLFVDSLHMFLYYQPKACLEVAGAGAGCDPDATYVALSQLYDDMLPLFFGILGISGLGTLATAQLFPASQQADPTRWASRAIGATIAVLVGKPIMWQTISTVNGISDAIYPESFTLAFAVPGLLEAVAELFLSFLALGVTLLILYKVSLAMILVLVLALSIRLMIIYAVFALFPVLMGLWIADTGPLKHGHSVAELGFKTFALLLGLGVLIAGILATGSAIAGGPEKSHYGDAKLEAVTDPAEGEPYFAMASARAFERGASPEEAVAAWRGADGAFAASTAGPPGGNELLYASTRERAVLDAGGGGGGGDEPSGPEDCSTTNADAEDGGMDGRSGYNAPSCNSPEDVTGESNAIVKMIAFFGVAIGVPAIIIKSFDTVAHVPTGGGSSTGGGGGGGGNTEIATGSDSAQQYRNSDDWEQVDSGTVDSGTESAVVFGDDDGGTQVYQKSEPESVPLSQQAMEAGGDLRSSIESDGFVGTARKGLDRGREAGGTATDKPMDVVGGAIGTGKEKVGNVRDAAEEGRLKETAVAGLSNGARRAAGGFKGGVQRGDQMMRAVDSGMNKSVAEVADDGLDYFRRNPLYRSGGDDPGMGGDDSPGGGSWDDYSDIDDDVAEMIGKMGERGPNGEDWQQGGFDVSDVDDDKMKAQFGQMFGHADDADANEEWEEGFDASDTDDDEMKAQFGRMFGHADDADVNEEWEEGFDAPDPDDGTGEMIGKMGERSRGPDGEDWQEEGFDAADADVDGFNEMFGDPDGSGAGGDDGPADNEFGPAGSRGGDTGSIGTPDDPDTGDIDFDMPDGDGDGDGMGETDAEN